MSSPGKASWCIWVRMSPGSMRSTRRSGRSAPSTAASCSKPALAARVGAPALVGLDRGVRGDGDDRGAGAEVGEERLDDPELGDEVRLQGRAQVAEPEVGERRAAGDGPSVPALSTTRSSPPRAWAAMARSARWASSVMSPTTGITIVRGLERGDGLGQVGGVAAVEDEGPAVVGEGAGEGEAEAPRGPGDGGGGGGGGHARDGTDAAVRRHRPAGGLCLRRRS